MLTKLEKVVTVTTVSKNNNQSCLVIFCVGNMLSSSSQFSPSSKHYKHETERPHEHEKLSSLYKLLKWPMVPSRLHTDHIVCRDETNQLHF